MSKVVKGQEDIFSMFGIIDEVAEQKKREEEERRKKLEELRKKTEKANAESGKSSTNKETKEVFEVNENTVIRYFGESLEIQSYFTSEELTEGVLKKTKDGEQRVKIDGEMLRKRMEKDYPELIKGMTDMIYLKDKNIVVPVMKAKKKGNCMETSSDLAEDVSSLFLNKKIPFTLLRDFVSVAKLYAEFELEIHADIYFRKGNYFLDFPKQKVHRYWCEVTECSESIVKRIGDDSIKVMEIHSHHNMRAIPSRQDNESEIIPGMYYAIIGSLTRPFPEINIRKRLLKKESWKIIKYHDVFEDPFLSLPSFEFDNVEVIG